MINAVTIILACSIRFTMVLQNSDYRNRSGWFDVDVTYDGSSLPPEIQAFTRWSERSITQSPGRSTDYAHLSTVHYVTANTDSKPYDGNTSSDGVPTHYIGQPGYRRYCHLDANLRHQRRGNRQNPYPSRTIGDGNDGNNYDVTYIRSIHGEITAIGLTVKAQ